MAEGKTWRKNLNDNLLLLNNFHLNSKNCNQASEKWAQDGLANYGIRFWIVDWIMQVK